MPKTPNTELLGSAAQIVHGVLKPLGFRKRRHAWNRTVEDGVVHFIGFQMAEYTPPPSRDIPDDARWRSFSSKFTVNLGVWFAEYAELTDLPTDPSFVSYGAVQSSLGYLMDVRTHVWWPIVGTPVEIAAEIVEPLMGRGLPWLDSVGHRSELMQQTPDKLLSLGAPPQLIAAVAVRESQPDLAVSVLRSAIVGNPDLPKLQNRMRSAAARLGLDLGL